MWGHEDLVLSRFLYSTRYISLRKSQNNALDMQSSAPLLPEDIFLIQVFIVEAASSSLAYGIYVVFAGLAAHLLL